jgi:hypothetical protein
LHIGGLWAYGEKCASGRADERIFSMDMKRIPAKSLLPPLKIAWKRY